jgi:hypothetical protein
MIFIQVTRVFDYGESMPIIYIKAGLMSLLVLLFNLIWTPDFLRKWGLGPSAPPHLGTSLLTTSEQLIWIGYLVYLKIRGIIFVLLQVLC